MKCLITGQFLKCETVKDKDGNNIPVTSIYSGDEVVKVRGMFAGGEVGSIMDALCDVKLKDYDGRKYLSINYQEGDV